MLLGKKATPLHDTFVCDDALGNLKTGVLPATFGVRLWNPAGAEVSGSIPVTITELGNGDYATVFTPNLTGRWLIIITHATFFPEGKRNDYDVYNQLFDDIDGAGSGSNIVTFTVQEVGSGPLIPDCTVQIFDATLTTLYAFGLTDAAGQLLRNLDDGNYKVMLKKLGQYTFDPLPKDLVVSGATPVLYEGAPFNPSSPPSPGTCVVWGFLHDISDDPAARDVVANLVDYKFFTTGGIQVIKSAKTVTAGPDGYWELVLNRSGEYTAENVKYSFKVGGVSMCEYIIPDIDNINFALLPENSP
jgi:hypothetical protein